jgi:hypothetical protein
MVKSGLELMGRSLLQQIALEHDAVAHSLQKLEFSRIVQEQGLKAALEWRDGPFPPSVSRTTQQSPLMTVSPAKCSAMNKPR